MRLLIQIHVFLEIFISCFLRSEVVWFIQWANQPGRTPGNRSPSGWRTDGSSSRAERNADNCGLDEEMLRVTD